MSGLIPGSKLFDTLMVLLDFSSNRQTTKRHDANYTTCKDLGPIVPWEWEQIIHSSSV